VENNPALHNQLLEGNLLRVAVEPAAVHGLGKWANLSPSLAIQLDQASSQPIQLSENTYRIATSQGFGRSGSAALPANLSASYAICHDILPLWM
jgi:hypothetical protein